MVILHSSDWHLGRRLYGRNRQKEFQEFLDWMLNQITEQKAQVLLVSGDIFDSSTPGTGAQQLYYRFLLKAKELNCRIIISGGNHDSPSFLDAPSALLQGLDIHILGGLPDETDKMLIEIPDAQGDVKLLVLALPYIRERDLREVGSGETLEEKERLFQNALESKIQSAVDLAEKRSAQLGQVPVICMAHLFCQGGISLADDGVRELYVGSLGGISPAVFSESLSYTALGHLHVPQTVAKRENLRYSGSPIAMGFGESDQQKQIVRLEWKNDQLEITTLEVPVFQRMKRLTGDREKILETLKEWKQQGEEAWLEVEYSGEELAGNLKMELEDLLQGSQMEILRLIHPQLNQELLTEDHWLPLDQLHPGEIFQRCLEDHQVPQEQWKELKGCHDYLLQHIQEEEQQ